LVAPQAVSGNYRVFLALFNVFDYVTQTHNLQKKEEKKVANLSKRNWSQLMDYAKV
jgi:hypothetical protein